MEFSKGICKQKEREEERSCTCWQEKKVTQKDRGFDLSGAEDYILGMTPDTLEAASVADTSKHTDVVDASAR